MDGIRALRIIAYLSISIGIAILTRGAWGFLIFGVLVLIDNFVFPSRPPEAPPPVAEDRETTEPPQ
jgi:hypothetical protein